MKILHFYRTYYPDSFGGVEQVIYQLVQGTLAHGMDAQVLTLTSNSNANLIKVADHQVHRARLNFQIASTGFSASAFFKFAQLAKKADVIHYHFPWPFMDVVHFATGIKKPTIVTYHSDIIRQKYLLKFYRPLMQRFLTSVDRIVATSPNYLKTSRVLDRFPEKVSVVPIGLDKSSYPTPSKKRLAYWQGRIGDKFFLFIGMLRYYKGLHILMEAAQELDYPIIIVGAGPVERELKVQADSLGLKKVQFLGEVSEDDKVALLTLSYGVVFPSHLRSEAFGISLLEGAMYGKPMISSEIGTGTTFVNIRNETGLVVPPSDPLALRQAMRYLWEHPDITADMGKRAEERYWKYFTAEQMVKSYIQLYSDVIDKWRYRDR